MIKIIVVENEKAISDSFVKLLNKLFNEIEIIDVCDNVNAAVLSIKKNSPDLVFLDVELNKGETGFDILKQIQQINFEIIFATAYDKYAVQAIKFSALDYLLKPVTEEDLTDAIYRFKQKKNSFNPKQLETLFSNLQRGAIMNQVALPTMNGLDFVPVENILYCQGEGSQTAAYLRTQALPIILSKTLKECEELFNSNGFFRIHKSYLINLNHIKKYIKGKDGQVLMSNDKTLEVSRNYKDAFLEHLKHR
jgi:two-component system LytT family response regulator